MNKKSNGDNPWRAAGFVGVMGIDIAICVSLGYFLGDRFGGSRGWVAFGVLIGLAVGIFTCVILLRRILEDTNE
jgi:hypothetical protein